MFLHRLGDAERTRLESDQHCDGMSAGGALSPNWLSRTMRVWVDALPTLDLAEVDLAGRPVPFERSRVFPYVFRHTFAQRHADKGVDADVLKELMGHETIPTTMGYYRVTAKRKREAQDRLGPLQLDAGGHRV